MAHSYNNNNTVWKIGQGNGTFVEPSENWVNKAGVPVHIFGWES